MAYGGMFDPKNSSSSNVVVLRSRILCNTRRLLSGSDSCSKPVEESFLLTFAEQLIFRVILSFKEKYSE